MSSSLFWFQMKQSARREMLVQLRQVQSYVHAVLFFIMILIFFPLALPLNPELFRMILPGLLWTTVLLAWLLSAEGLFQPDYEDGVIEQWMISPFPLSSRLSIKITVHWAFTLLPMMVISPILAMIFQLSWLETRVFLWALLLGTPAMAYMTALALALSAGLKEKGILMALIVWPLTLPVMILGGDACFSAMNGGNCMGQLALLSAMSLAAIVFLPKVIAAVMRVTL